MLFVSKYLTDFFDTLLGKKLYIKGYKLDPEKIRQSFSRKPGWTDQTWDIYWYQPIIDAIPRTAYKYVGCGLEPNGDFNLVLVLDDGDDEAALKSTNVEPSEPLREALEVLTPGVWESQE